MEASVALLEEQPPATAPARCANCEAPLTGKYCASCGQKQLDHHEYSLWHFIQHAMHDVTHFDTKLLRSIVPLVTMPGLVTSEYLAGKRGRYLRPLQTFILLNIIFFFVGSRVGLFNFTYDMFVKNRRLVTGQSPAQMLEAARVKSGKPVEEFRAQFDEKLVHLKKSLVIVMVILFAALLAIVHARSKRYFVEHLIFSLHFYSFWLIVTLVVPLTVLGVLLATKFFVGAAQGTVARPRAHIGEDALLSMMFVGCAIYLMEAVRRVYGVGRLRAIAEGVVLSAAVIGIIAVYRDVLFYVVVWSM